MVAMVLLMKLCRARVAAPNMWSEEAVSAVFSSLIDISTVYEVVGTGSEIEFMAASAAHQNQDAKALPVSSKAWASMAKSLQPTFCIGTSSQEEVKLVLGELSKGLSTYNNRADVSHSVEMESRVQKNKIQWTMKTIQASASAKRRQKRLSISWRTALLHFGSSSRTT